MAVSPIQTERDTSTPADQFDALLREADAREAARLRHPTAGPWLRWLQRTAILFVSLCLWAVILAGLSRQLLG